MTPVVQTANVSALQLVRRVRNASKLTPAQALVIARAQVRANRRKQPW